MRCETFPGHDPRRSGPAERDVFSRRRERVVSMGISIIAGGGDILRFFNLEPTRITVQYRFPSSFLLCNMI